MSLKKGIPLGLTLPQLNSMRQLAKSCHNVTSKTQPSVKLLQYINGSYEMCCGMKYRTSVNGSFFSSVTVP